MSPSVLQLCLIFLAGLTAGGIVTALFYRAKIARLTERLFHYEQLQKEFKATAAEVLQNTAEQFLSSAIKDLRQVKTETDESIDKKKNDISASVSDMKARLEDTQKIVKKFEEERLVMYSKLEQSLDQVLSAEQAIRIETGALKRVLTSSTGVRGQWGEKILQEILDQNNLVRGIHYETQVHLSGESDKTSRPDFIINLPGNKRLIIDAKEVTGEYLLAQETEDPENQKTHYQKLVSNIRDNFIKLSRKEYQSLLDPDIPFVVMFIPSEAAIRAAFATDPDIFQEATQRHVILASPMTIVPLVYLIAHSWQQQRLATNATELGTAVEELGNRLFKFIEHLQQVRGGIKKAAESWDRAIGSWQTRISPQIEKTKLLGGKLKEAEELTPIDTELQSQEKLEKNS